ncbi:MAG: FliM/FliN family flagellar motor switch protein [Bradymonadales bacterium]|nr:FliM/FliN family flagellar motor switch protein [Bradymonadales bacterium]
MIHAYPFLTLPRVSRAEVTVIDGLHRAMPLWYQACAMLERIAGPDVRLQVMHIDAVRPQEPAMGAGWSGVLRDAGLQEVGWVHLDAPLAQSLASMVLCGRPPDRLEMRPLLDVEQEALQLLVAHLLSRGQTTLQAAGIPRLFERRPQPPWLGRVRCKVELQGVGGLLTLWTDPRFWSSREEDDPLGGQAEIQARMRTELWRSCRLRMRLRIGRFQLGAEEIPSLRVGDLLLPGGWTSVALPEVGHLMLGCHPVAQGTVTFQDGIRLVLTGAVVAQGGEMDWDEEKTVEIRPEVPLTEDTPTLESRQVSLDLVVGRLDMTLGELIGLRPGRVLTLSRRTDAPIEVGLDGRPIGQGELVEVEGRLGVRLVSVANMPEPTGERTC